MMRSPAIWIISAMVVGFAAWVLWTSRPAPLETAMELNGTRQGDRDSAAEEVRAVATQITEISDKIEGIDQRQAEETDRVRQETELSIAGIRETIEGLKDEYRTPPEVIESLVQIGDRLTALEISLDDGGGVDFEYPVGSSAPIPSIIWIEPLNATSSAALEVEGIGDLIPTDIALRGEPPPPDPRYTIPPSSIIYATALTSLVGRIPVNGRLETPWRFKLISSGQNLTSRRFEVPGLEGVIWTGIAHGDYTLSCVSGTIDTISYVFDDGSVHTQRSPVDPDDITNGMAWISDARGNPCIKGDLKTNVPQTIRRSVVAGTFSGLAQGYADALSTRSTDSSGTTSTTVTGDAAEYALASAASEAISESNQWLQRHLGQSFDAIYVPAGQEVVIHIEQQVHIDEQPDGRRLDHSLTESALRVESDAKFGTLD